MEEELCQACQTGDMNKVLQLVNQGCNPRRNVKPSHKRKPIHYAAAHGHLELVRTLIEKCWCRPDWTDRKGRNALHYACCYGRIDVVRYLVIDKRCSYYAWDRGKMTSMHYACLSETMNLVDLFEMEIGFRSGQVVVQSEKHYEIVKFLFSAGYDPTYQQEKGTKLPLALHVACRYGICEFVKHLIERYKYDLEECNVMGNTPLLLACQHGKLDIVRYLMEEKHCNSRNDAALFLACQHGKLEIVRYLIEKQHCNMTSCHVRSGNNSLHVACLHNQTEVVDYLVKMGCDTTICNPENETPLHIACCSGSLQIARLVGNAFDQQAYETERSKYETHKQRTFKNLMTTVTNMYSDNYESQQCIKLDLLQLHLSDSHQESYPSPLHVACKKGNVEIVKFLIAEKLWNPELEDRNGFTPLHSACYSYVAKDPQNTFTWLLDEHLAESVSTLEVVTFLVNECNSDPMNSSRRSGENVMNIACKAEKLDLVMALTSKNVNCQDTSGNTPLHLACKYVNLKVVKYLVEEKQCKLTIQNAKRQLPVHIACESKSLELVKLVSDCDLNTLTIDHATPLHTACTDGSLDIIEYFVTEKQFQHPKNSASMHVHAICKAGKLVLIKVLATPQNVKCQDSVGNTPLHIACKYKHLKLAMYLVNEVHSDILHCNKMGESPLHIACQEEALAIVQFLVLGKHCSHNAQSMIGDLPLHIACRKKSLEMVKLVSDCNVNSITRNENAMDCIPYLVKYQTEFYPHPLIYRNGTTPLHIACQEKALDIVRYLCVEKRADLNIRNSEDELPLHIACDKHSLEMVKLVSDCTDPNARAHTGDTPLHLACKHGDIDIVKYLLEEKQCDPKLEDRNGELPLHYACMHSLEVVQLVTNWDVEIRPPTSYRQSGKHPLLTACSRGALDIVRYLVEEKQCDPNPKDHSDGDLLQYACGCTTEKPDTINTDLVRYLVIKCSCDPMEQGYGSSPMQVACNQGNLELVKALTSNKVNFLDDKGNSPLHVACSYRQVEIVRFLAEEKHCDQNIRNDEGELALHIACRESSVELVKLVASNCTKVNAETTKGVTPLHLACEHRSNEIVKILTKEKHCDQSICNKQGESALHIACRERSFDNVKLLTECDINSQAVGGMTPLHLACMTHSAEIVEYLLCERYCNPNLTDKEGNTALHWTCTSGDVEAATVLTQKSQCDQNIQNSKGELALHVACKLVDRTDDSDRLVQVQLQMKTLVEVASSNCNPNIQDNDGDTPLHVAVRNAAEEVVKYLVQIKNCDTTISNNDGMLPLHIACHLYLGLKIIELVGSKCKQDAIDKNGDTPLHIACQRSKPKVASFLIDKLNCNPNIKDTTGHTPLHIACARGDTQLVEVLTGSDPNSQNADGKTPLHLACYNRSFSIVCYLLDDEMQSNADLQNNAGELPLHVLCSMRSSPSLIDIVKVVSSFTKNPNSPNVFGNTPLHIACELNDEEIVQHLLKEKNCVADIQNNIGELPLHLACISGSLSIARMVSECDPNRQIKEDSTTLPDSLQTTHLTWQTSSHKRKVLNSTIGNTPLHIACSQTNLDLVRFLMEEMNCSCCISNTLGELPLHIACTKLSRYNSTKNPMVFLIIKLVSNCDVDSVTKKGTTALHIVCEHGTHEVIEYLIQTKKCKTAIQDNNGNTPLHIICRNGQNGTDILNLLCEADQSSQVVQNNDGELPLHIACSHNSLYLIQKVSNCNVNTTTTSGNTALHLACFRDAWDRYTHTEYMQTIQYLTEKKQCSVKIQNNKGKVPLHIACEKNSLAMVKLVSECDVNLQTENGDSPIHIACRGQDTSIIIFLVNTKHCNLTTPNKSNELPIHIACSKHPLDVVKLISKGNVDVNSQTQTGDTPLHIACSHFVRVHKESRSPNSFSHYCDEYLQIIKYLVREKKCSLSIPNHHSELPVHLACHYHSLQIVKVVSEGQVDLNSQTQTGDTPLHIACSNFVRVHKESRSPDSFTHCRYEYLQLVKYLVRGKKCSLSIPNHNGVLPVHTACCYHSLDIVKMVSEGQVDLNSQTQSGETPLHIACKKGKTEVVRYLVDVKKCDQNVQNDDGELPLHIACRYRAPHELVKLVSNCNVDATTKSGDTPLHYVVRSHSTNVFVGEPVNELLIFLIKSKNCKPNCQNNEGMSPLHYLCSSSRHETKEAIECLLSTGRVNPSLADSKGQTPLMLTNDKEVIKLLLSYGADPSPLYDMNNIFFEKYSKSPPPTPLKVLVLGEASTGKTTLTLTLKCEGCPDPEQIAPQDHTAGIIPSDFNSETYGLVTFYDFAGQHEYYASHEAVIHTVVRKSPPVILLLVKLSEDRNVIKQKLLKWLSYVENQCVSVHGTAHLIIVGSHADEVRSQGKDPQVKMNSVLGPLQSRFKESCVEFTATITMDCRQPNSMDVDKLRQHLKDSSAQLRDVGVMNFISHCIYVCLLSQFSSLAAVPLTEAIIAIGRITKHSYYSSSNQEAKTLLPKQADDVAVILQELNDKGHIIFLENHERIWKSWIIFNKEAILADLNGTIFAPQSFVQYQNMTSNSTGVVKFSKIAQCHLFKKYNPNMLVGFLSHMEFCQEIHDREVLDILGCPSVDSYPSNERYFFFPGLVKLEAPHEIWKTDRIFKYKCGWILQCARKDQFLTPHFLQVLVLRLAFTFALSPSKPSAKCELPVIMRHCTVWKNGIQWLNRDGVEAVVEVVEQSQAVVVMLRCSGKTKSEWACLHLRSAIICKVLKAAEKFCPNVSTAESFIHPDDVCYPPKPSREICLYSVESVAETVVEAKPFILPSQGQSHVAIEELLLLEVYADLGEDILHKLFDRPYKRPSDRLLYEIADCIAQDESTCKQKKELLCLIFKPPPTLLAERIAHAPPGITHELVRILQIGKDREYNCTIHNIRKKLDEYSIFCGRNPLVS